MKKFIIQSILLLAVIFTALYLFNSDIQITDLPFGPATSSEGVVKINESSIKVEIADTQAKRSKGLSGRESLASDEGMLFIFPKEDIYPFWMKGITFALDFVWIRDLAVVDLLENVPPAPAGQPDSSLPIYQSKVEINKVLEIPAGTVQRLNIRVGDTIKITQ